MLLPSPLLLRWFAVSIVIFESCSSVENVTSVPRLLLFAIFLLSQNLHNIGGRDGGVDVHDSILGVRIAAERALLGICRGEAPGWCALGAINLQRKSG